MARRTAVVVMVVVMMLTATQVHADWKWGEDNPTHGPASASSVVTSSSSTSTSSSSSSSSSSSPQVEEVNDAAETTTQPPTDMDQDTVQQHFTIKKSRALQPIPTESRSLEAAPSDTEPRFIGPLKKKLCSVGLGFNMHDGMQSRVLVGGVQSEPFSVQMGAKRGCVLAPVLFNIILLAVA
ncbi:hypothetical protein Hamer_G009569 [Homarus americanus]|uniref:Uncharacterized protein n=1 Tax=Homarus americanus TaxID=6706 RepID=A0A8J5N2S4_HOMAM|nr:hypothetical protein Hamer_G009569 [Homarus americanus]